MLSLLVITAMRFTFCFIILSIRSCFHLSDISRINKMAMQSHNTGLIILGGGLVKHHICNANMMVCMILLGGGLHC